MTSLAQLIDRANSHHEEPTGDHFYDKTPTPKGPTGGERDVDACARIVIVDTKVADPRIVSPWDKGSRAERELRWHFSESAGELGERGGHEAFMYRCQTGGGDGTTALVIDQQIEEALDYRFQTARGPSLRARWAAEKESRIRAALKQVTPEEYGDLAVSFSLRRPEPTVMVLLSQSDQRLEPLITCLIRMGGMSIKEVVKKSEAFGQAADLARGRLTRALASYELASGIATPASGEPPSAPTNGKATSRRPSRALSPAMLVSASHKGAGSRRLKAAAA